MAQNARKTEKGQVLSMEKILYAPPVPNSLGGLFPKALLTDGTKGRGIGKKCRTSHGHLQLVTAKWTGASRLLITFRARFCTHAGDGTGELATGRKSDKEHEECQWEKERGKSKAKDQFGTS
ncbi:hypothetical protein niasHS_012039 [Heterodera schachtii]|uniref:Uncharacterized protein n=1 Tax=Heterodera schachtii TaxID=97005 RepID=A0ABD2IYH6_HETSC